MSATVAELAIGTLSQIPKGEGRNFVVGGTTVAVFHTWDGNVFATQPDCPHKKGPLADGLLGASTVVCPLHDRTYDLASGRELGTDCAIKTYPVRSS